MSLLHKQLWLTAIEEQLRPKYEILRTLAKDDSGEVYGNGKFRKVTIQNAGGDPAVTINGTSYPATASKRVDTPLTYDVDKYETEPKLVTREEVVSESPEKMNSVIESMFGSLGTAAMYNSFARWYNSGQTTILTTGANTPDTAAGATGTTKTFTVKDVIKAKAALDAQDVPMENRILLLPSSMANQLLEEVTTTNSNISFIEKDGMMIFSQLFWGFKIVQMTRVVQVDAAGDALLYGETGALKEVGYAYHKDAVSIAKDEPFIFHNEGDALNFGDIISGQLFLGASYRRNDFKGVVQVKQA